MELSNELGTTLKKIEMTLEFGNVKYPVSFSNIEDKKSSKYEISMIGEACEYFLKVPKILISKCDADKTNNISVCSDKIKYTISK